MIVIHRPICSGDLNGLVQYLHKTIEISATKKAVTSLSPQIKELGNEYRLRCDHILNFTDVGPELFNAAQDPASFNGT